MSKSMYKAILKIMIATEKEENEEEERINY